MTACSISPWGIMPQFYSAKPSLVKAFVEPNLLNVLTSSLVTTECANSVRTALIEEIDKIYDECKEEGWANLKKEKSLPLSYKSTVQAKEFASYIEDLPQPYVIPYVNGCIGFEWNSCNKAISIIFKPEGSYIYSIITNTLNDFGENTQNTANQRALFQRISQILTKEPC